MTTVAKSSIDCFENPEPGRDYEILLECPEFTCLCPMTGQPDFADFKFTYIPDQLCVELKSLKLYLWSYRDQGAFHEAVTNQIADHLIEKLQPRYLEVSARFKTRGGIDTTIKVTHEDRPQ